MVRSIPPIWQKLDGHRQICHSWQDQFERGVSAMNILFLAAFVAVVVALLERNHRRTSLLPRAPGGAADDRDLVRVRHDLPGPPADTGRPRLHLQAGRPPRAREAATC
jgi:hypothetical protein